MAREGPDPARWEQVSEIFTAALGLSAPDRRAYLDECCAGNSELRSEIESLLASHAGSEGFLEAGIGGNGAISNLGEIFESGRENNPSPTLPSQIGGRYQVGRLLGSGGMGMVYQARDQQLNREVAVKLLTPGGLQDESARKRFRSEALALSRINHPNIATIHDFGTQEGIDYLVMEYISGPSLKDRIQDGPLPEREVLQLGMQLAEGLVSAHEQGIIHRDLKPANLKLTSDGRLKILDFGIAQATLVAGTAATKSIEPKLFAGTLPYIAPELWEGNEADQRSDIWSVGVVLYELVTGRMAFPGMGTELINNILNYPPVLPSRINDQISAGLERVILKCLEKNRRQRYQTAAKLLDDLRQLNQSTVLLRAVIQRRKRRFTLAGLAFISVAVLAAGGLLLQKRVLRRPQIPAVNTIAVLPLVNLSGDATQEYFTNGLTESLTTSLGQIRSLHVVSRTSAMHYQGSHEPLPTIARDLHANLVLEGSVQKAGKRVRITAQLIDAATDRHLWAEAYDRELSDVLSLEDEIARTIAHQVQAQLTPEEERRLTLPRSVNPEAHDAYLEGRFYWNQRTPRSLSRAISRFQTAIRIDPAFAPAYVGLADSYVLLSDYQAAPSNESFPKAKAAISKALELDPNLATAHSALAYVLFRFDWDWKGAEAEFKRALELNFNDATAHHWYGEYLTMMGRFDEGLREVRTAEDLEPLSEIITADEGWFLYLARRYDKSIDHLHNMVTTHPAFSPAWFYLGESLEQKGMYAEAIQAYQRGIALTQGATKTSGLGHVYALAGETKSAEQVLNELKQRGFQSPIAIAIIEAGLRHNDEAIHWLGTGYRQRNDGLIYLKVHPFFDPIRNDPRFQQLLKVMAFPN